MKYNCPNCGAPITGRQCEYCGTIVKEDPLFPNRVFIERQGAKKICAEVAISRELALLNEDAMGEYAKARMASTMADALQDAIALVVRNDPYTNAVIVRGELRVLDPSFRFYDSGRGRDDS